MMQYNTMLPKDSIFISLDFKNYLLDSLALKLYLYKEKEEFVDSLVFSLNPNGNNNISFNNVNAGWVEFMLSGSTSNSSDSISLQIQHADIFAKNHDLKVWPQSQDSDLNVELFIPVRKIVELDEIRNKKIIGLGESVHGTRTISKEKSELLKKLLDNNVKLVCFENSLDICLNWDLYVQGIHPYSYRYKILEQVKESLGDASGQVLLLDEIRKINATRKDANKIHIVGLDLRDKKGNFFDFFMAYKSLNRNKGFLDQVILKMDSLQFDNLFYLRYGNNISTFLQYMDTTKLKFSNLTDAIKSETKLKPLMKEKNYHFLLDALSLNIPTSYDYNNKRSIDRDRVMWDIFQKAIECYAPKENDRVVVLSHSLHVSRTYHPRYGRNDLLKPKRLGSYITQKFNDNYWAISFQVGAGDIKSYNPIRNLTGISKLQDPIDGSFEKAAEKTELNKFYCRSRDLKNDWYTYRMIGNSADKKSQFYFLSKDRFDGYVFISECTSSYIDRSDFRPLPTFNIEHYMDSIGISNTHYSKVFKYDTDTFNISVPKNFRYYKTGLNVFPRSKSGVFISDDMNCIVVIDDCIMMYDKQVLQNNRQLSTLLIKNFTKEVVYNMMYDFEISSPYNNIYGEKAKNRNRSFELLFNTRKNDYIDFKNKEYAKKTFNADQAIEYYIDTDIYFSGKYYKHKNIITIGKNRNVMHIYCYYTDKGFTQKEKHRKSIESIIKYNQ